jgi:hypothetical protein
MDSETPNELYSHSYQFYQISFLIVVSSQTIEFLFGQVLKIDCLLMLRLSWDVYY